MSRRRIIPIVEGHGEEAAVPRLIHRWLHHRRFDDHFEVLERAINAKGCGILKAPYDRSRHRGIEHYVQTALRARPDAILVVLDGDDECATRTRDDSLGPMLLARARTVAPQIPLSVGVANREFEAWFLANLTSLRQAGLILPERLNGTLVAEAPRDCKRLISGLLGRRYEEKIDQPALVDCISFSPRVKFRSASFGKLLKDLDRIVREARSLKTPP